MRNFTTICKRHIRWELLRSCSEGSSSLRELPAWRPADATSKETISGTQHPNHSIPKTNRCEEWANGWWEFLLRLPQVIPEGIELSNPEKTKPYPKDWKFSFIRWPFLRSRKFLNSVSSDDRSFGLGSFWICWNGDGVLLPNPWKWSQFNHPTQGWGRIGFSKSARLRAQTVSQIGPWSIFPIEWYPSSPRF